MPPWLAMPRNTKVAYQTISADIVGLRNHEQQVVIQRMNTGTCDRSCAVHWQPLQGAFGGGRRLRCAPADIQLSIGDDHHTAICPEGFVVQGGHACRPSTSLAPPVGHEAPVNRRTPAPKRMLRS